MFGKRNSISREFHLHAQEIYSKAFNDLIQKDIEFFKGDLSNVDMNFDSFCRAFVASTIGDWNITYFLPNFNVVGDRPKSFNKREKEIVAYLREALVEGHESLYLLGKEGDLMPPGEGIPFEKSIWARSYLLSKKLNDSLAQTYKGLEFTKVHKALLNSDWKISHTITDVLTTNLDRAVVAKLNQEEEELINALLDLAPIIFLDWAKSEARASITSSAMSWPD